MKTKKCSTCGEVKELNSDNFNKKGGNVFRNQCKVCTKKKAAEWRANNKHRVQKRNKYGKGDMRCSMVEDDQYKIVKVECHSPKCTRKLDILIDTFSKRKPPIKFCGTCKLKEDELDDGSYDCAPSELPLLDSVGGYLEYGEG